MEYIYRTGNKIIYSSISFLVQKNKERSIQTLSLSDCNTLLIIGKIRMIDYNEVLE